MSEFAAAVFQEAKEPALPHHFMVDQLKRFVDAGAGVHEQWRDYGAQEWKLRDDWILETVKHLAIVNIAGLAGATALYGADKGFALKISIGSFGIGLLLALIDLFTNAKAHYLNGLRANKYRLEAKTAKSWSELTAAATAKWTSDAGDRCTECAEVAGVMSAIFAIAGMVSLVWHLT
ncbi:hypothetical protein [Achromobacter animicus]|uniref:hypothetical protein n=1 Tax=Achromobacter animicus TaxID=1389935 RepID=UPI00345ED2F8